MKSTLSVSASVDNASWSYRLHLRQLLRMMRFSLKLMCSKRWRQESRSRRSMLSLYDLRSQQRDIMSQSQAQVGVPFFFLRIVLSIISTSFLSWSNQFVKLIISQILVLFQPLWSQLSSCLYLQQQLASMSSSFRQRVSLQSERFLSSVSFLRMISLSSDILAERFSLSQAF